MELLIIRHGQSEADLIGVHEGRADFPLTELGEQQAKYLTEYVAANFPPNLILTSPLKRAKKTALILQEKIGCNLNEETDLMEFNNGVLAGMSRKEALIRYPMPKNGRAPHVPIQDGESELAFRYRAERVFSKMISEYQDYERVAVVSHGGLISNLLKAALNQPFNNGCAFKTGDTGMHLLEIKNNFRTVGFINNQVHLSQFKV